MAEDEKPPQEEKPPKEKAEAAEKPKEPHAKKRKKISRMSLAEVEAELKQAQEKMGGFGSDFARHLLARKKELGVS